MILSVIFVGYVSKLPNLVRSCQQPQQETAADKEEREKAMRIAEKQGNTPPRGSVKSDICVVQNHVIYHAI